MSKGMNEEPKIVREFDNEEDAMIHDLRQAIKAAVERVYEESGVDGAYYPVVAKLVVLQGDSFEPMREMVVYDGANNIWERCRFCGAETHYQHRIKDANKALFGDEQVAMCPGCLGKWLAGKGNV